MSTWRLQKNVVSCIELDRPGQGGESSVESVSGGVEPHGGDPASRQTHKRSRTMIRAISVVASTYRRSPSWLPPSRSPACQRSRTSRAMSVQPLRL